MDYGKRGDQIRCKCWHGVGYQTACSSAPLSCAAPLWPSSGCMSHSFCDSSLQIFDIDRTPKSNTPLAAAWVALFCASPSPAISTFWKPLKGPSTCISSQSESVYNWASSAFTFRPDATRTWNLRQKEPTCFVLLAAKHCGILWHVTPFARLYATERFIFQCFCSCWKMTANEKPWFLMVYPTLARHRTIRGSCERTGSVWLSRSSGKSHWPNLSLIHSHPSRTMLPSAP